MEELVTLANRLAGAGFGTLLFVILWGSYKGLWVWGKDLLAERERYEALLLKEQQDKDWWRTVAIKATGIAEGTVSAASAALNATPPRK